MKMYQKRLAVIPVLCLCAALAGCGKKQIDIMTDLDMSFDGYNGYGSSALSKGNWISQIEAEFGSEMGLLELAAMEEALYDAVNYTVTPSENLTNGDKVTVVVDVDNTKLENYQFKLSGGETTFTVEGLGEIEAFDPFEGVAVNFSGMFPNGSASVNTTDSRNDISLNYILDKSSGLSNGDEVTVSISSPGGSDIEEYCRSYGKMPTATEKTFTVSDLAGYAMKLEEIPEDTKQKMQSQAEDGIRSSASSWESGNTLKNIELLGYYFLTPKEGFSVSLNNELYYVFKITADITGYETEEEAKADGAQMMTREDTYYTYYRYKDIVILPDGTCSVDLSAGTQPSNTVNSKYGTYSWFSMSYYRFYGYGDLDSMFNDCVTSKISNYTYENTVK